MRWSTAQPWISLTHKNKKKFKKRCIACHWTALTLMTLATVTVYIPTIIYFLIQAALRRPFIIVLLAIYHLKYKKHKANKEMLPVCCKIRDCFLRHGLDICSCLRCKKKPNKNNNKKLLFFSICIQHQFIQHCIYWKLYAHTTNTAFSLQTAPQPS